MDQVQPAGSWKITDNTCQANVLPELVFISRSSLDVCSRWVEKAREMIKFVGELNAWKGWEAGW